MILDFLTEFAVNQAVPTAIGSAQVGDSIDMSGGLPLPGFTRIGEDASRQMHIHITPTVAFTSGGAATVQFSLVSDAQDPVVFASATVHAQTAVIPIASLILGAPIFITPPMLQGERYYGIVATVGTAVLTAGSVTSGFMFDPIGNVSYPDAQN